MLDIPFALIERLSRRVMLILALGHLATFIVAAQSGQTLEEYLRYAQQNLFLAVLHGALVLTAAIHAAIGLRAAAASILGVKGMVLTSFTLATFWGLFATGLYGVIAIFVAPSG